jgi:hypothetical protein
VPVSTGSSITIVDSSFKGTVQEVLAALYPGIRFQGAYIWHGQSPVDPHPGTKRGYLQHVTEPGNHGDIWETVTYEYSMHGPYASPTGYAPDGMPIQLPIRDTDEPLGKIRLRTVAPQYRDLRVRDAIMVANQHAAADYARHIAELPDPRRELEAGVAAFHVDTGSWRHDAAPTTPTAYLTYLDSFVIGGRQRSPAAT